MPNSEIANLTEDTAPLATDWLYKVNAAGTVDGKVALGRVLGTLGPTGLVKATNGLYHFPANATVGAVSSYGASTASMAQIAAWWPFYVPFAKTVDAVSFYCGTGEAGSSMRFALYNVNATTLLPTTLITDFGTVATDTAGEKTLTGLSQSVSGHYAMMAWNSNHASVRNWAVAYNPGGWLSFWGLSTPGAGIIRLGHFATGVDYSAGAPANAPALTDITQNSNANKPIGFLRYT